MASVRDTISRFKHFVENSTGKPLDETTMPPLFAYSILRMTTNAVIAQGENNGDEPDAGLEYTIPCFTLEKVDAVADCPCAPPSGCFFMRSVDDLPAAQDGRPLAVTVLAPDCRNCEGENKEFAYVPWNDFQSKINSRYSFMREGLYYTLKNLGRKQKLYIYTNSRFSDIKRVAVRLIPKDPIELLYIPACEPKPVCNVLETEFYIPQDKENAVFLQSMQLLGMALNLSGGGDNTANSNPDNRAQPSGG